MKFPIEIPQNEKPRADHTAWHTSKRISAQQNTTFQMTLGSDTYYLFNDLIWLMFLPIKLQKTVRNTQRNLLKLKWRTLYLWFKIISTITYQNSNRVCFCWFTVLTVPTLFLSLLSALTSVTSWFRDNVSWQRVSACFAQLCVGLYVRVWYASKCTNGVHLSERECVSHWSCFRYTVQIHYIHYIPLHPSIRSPS